MPPRTRAKPAHQSTPWASGKHKAPPSGRRKPWTKRVQQGFRRQLRKRPSLGLILQIAFAVTAVALLVTGLLLETMLFYLAAALSGLGALATRRAVVLEQERQRKNAGPKVTMPPPSSRPRKPRTQPGGATPPPSSANGVVICTETKKPTKDCDCASRHITTEAKSRQFGRPIGSPYGSRKKQGAARNTDKSGV